MKNALAISPADAAPAPMRRSKEDTANRGELNGINIEMTENGCIVRCSFDPKKIDPKRSRYEQMPEDEKYSFDDCNKAAAYVKGMMTGHEEYEKAEDKGGKGKKKPEGGKESEE